MDKNSLTAYGTAIVIAVIGAVLCFTVLESTAMGVVCLVIVAMLVLIATLTSRGATRSSGRT